MAETTATTGTSTSSAGTEPEEVRARTGAAQEESAASEGAGAPDEPEADGAGTAEPVTGIQAADAAVGGGAPAADPGAADAARAVGPAQADAPSAAPSDPAPSDAAPRSDPAPVAAPLESPPTGTVAPEAPEAPEAPGPAGTSRGPELTAAHLPTVAARPADLADLVTAPPPGGGEGVHEPRPHGQAGGSPEPGGHRGQARGSRRDDPGHGGREAPAAGPYGAPPLRPDLLRPPAGPSPSHPDAGGPGRRMDTVPVRATGSPVGRPSVGAPGPGVPASAVLSTAAPPVSAPPRTTGIPTRPSTPRVGGRGAAIGAAKVTEGLRPPRASAPRGPRRARLNLKRVDPWSVMKFSFAVSLVLFIVMIVAASVLYLALDTMGVFTSINDTVTDLIASGSAEEGGDAFEINAQGVIGTAAVLGALNVLLFTSLATLGAFIYNVCADLVGGVEVTLAERD